MCFPTGKGSNVCLRSFRDEIQSLSKTIGDLVHGLPRHSSASPADTLQLPCLRSVMTSRDDLYYALCSLAELFDESQEDTTESSSNSTFSNTEIQDAHNGNKMRTVNKVVYSLSSGVSSSSRDVRWV